MSSVGLYYCVTKGEIPRKNVIVIIGISKKMNEIAVNINHRRTRSIANGQDNGIATPTIAIIIARPITNTPSTNLIVNHRSNSAMGKRKLLSGLSSWIRSSQIFF
jgi:hypothetical protein